MRPFNTFSIVARCPSTGRLGVAISTAVPAVGGMCSYLAAGTGAIATQSWVNPYLGIDGLQALREGVGAQPTLDWLLAQDPGRNLRQIGVVDRHGTVAVHTGTECVGWAGHRTGEQFTVLLRRTRADGRRVFCGTGDNFPTALAVAAESQMAVEGERLNDSIGMLAEMSGNGDLQAFAAQGGERASALEVQQLAASAGWGTGTPGVQVDVEPVAADRMETVAGERLESDTFEQPAVPDAPRGTGRRGR